MNAQQLADVMENLAERLRRANGLADGDQVTLDRQDVRDAAELILVLRRLVPRACSALPAQDIIHAFGAPGDWGYATPLGKALVTLYTGRPGEENE